MIENRFNDLVAAAARSHMANRLDEAETFARQALELDSSGLDARFVLGLVGLKKNQPELAIENFQAVREGDAHSFDARFWLSVTLRRQKRVSEATTAAEEAVKLNPRSEQAQNELGLCYLEINRGEPAENCFRTACRLSPRVPSYWENLGRALRLLEKTREAITAFRTAVSIGSPKPQLLYRLGDACADANQFDEAENCARKILAADPDSVPGNILLAIALIGQDRVRDAAQYAQRAVERDPGNARAIAYYGRTLQSLGQMEDANRQFEKSIELEPRQGSAYHSLTHNRKVTEDDLELMARMRELITEGSLPRRELIQLEYSLGKAHEDLKQYETAMSHFDAANRLDHEMKVGVAPFHPEELRKSADFILDTFTPAFLESQRNWGQPSDLPVFVVGMMRSGTTLAEQILSSHPEVGAAGEQLYWPQKVGYCEKMFDGSHATFLGKTLRGLAESYLQVLKRLSPNTLRVVDKMNSNYLILGLLHIAFPNARIVHMRRHPVDTCLSIWATPVANDIDLCASKENVVSMYLEYLRIMEHWRQLLPEDRFLDVQYEELVENKEAVTRNMIDFCGLEWDEACLNPELNDRAVKTPSVWQVRQPVYKTSVARWKRYENCLGPFVKLHDCS
jgi:tetratricopeptide (TPR) repeat protein